MAWVSFLEDILHEAAILAGLVGGGQSELATGASAHDPVDLMNICMTIGAKADDIFRDVVEGNEVCMMGAKVIM